MSDEPQRTPMPMSGWTIETYAAHNEAIRAAEEKFQGERDRRYSEVNIEREKALKIKETADLAALQLAREIQIYKDEKANELREQIERERVTYATKIDLIAFTEKMDATLNPILDFVSSSRGQGVGIGQIGALIFGIVVALGVVFEIGRSFIPNTTSQPVYVTTAPNQPVTKP